MSSTRRSTTTSWMSMMRSAAIGDVVSLSHALSHGDGVAVAQRHFLDAHTRLAIDAAQRSSRDGRVGDSLATTTTALFGEGGGCDDWTPLHVAVMEGHAEAIALLAASCPAWIAAPDADGYTPMDWAAFLGDLVAVLILLSHARRSHHYYAVHAKGGGGAEATAAGADLRRAETIAIRTRNKEMLDAFDAFRMDTDQPRLYAQSAYDNNNNGVEQNGNNNDNVHDDASKEGSRHDIGYDVSRGGGRRDGVAHGASIVPVYEHVVLPQESLTTIQLRYGATLQELRRLNADRLDQINFENGELQIGSLIRVPMLLLSERAVAATSASPTPSSQKWQSSARSTKARPLSAPSPHRDDYDDAAAAYGYSTLHQYDDRRRDEDDHDVPQHVYIRRPDENVESRPQQPIPASRTAAAKMSPYAESTPPRPEATPTGKGQAVASRTSSSTDGAAARPHDNSGRPLQQQHHQAAPSLSNPQRRGAPAAATRESTTTTPPPNAAPKSENDDDLAFDDFSSSDGDNANSETASTLGDAEDIDGGDSREDEIEQMLTAARASRDARRRELDKAYRERRHELLRNAKKDAAAANYNDADEQLAAENLRSILEQAEREHSHRLADLEARENQRNGNLRKKIDTQREKNEQRRLRRQQRERQEMEDFAEQCRRQDETIASELALARQQQDEELVRRMLQEQQRHRDMHDDEIKRRQALHARREAELDRRRKARDERLRVAEEVAQRQQDMQRQIDEANARGESERLQALMAEDAARRAAEEKRVEQERQRESTARLAHAERDAAASKQRLELLEQRRKADEENNLKLEIRHAQLKSESEKRLEQARGSGDRQREQDAQRYLEDLKLLDERRRQRLTAEERLRSEAHERELRRDVAATEDYARIDRQREEYAAAVSRRHEEEEEALRVFQERVRRDASERATQLEIRRRDAARRDEEMRAAQLRDDRTRYKELQLEQERQQRLETERSRALEAADRQRQDDFEAELVRIRNNSKNDVARRVQAMQSDAAANRLKIEEEMRRRRENERRLREQDQARRLEEAKARGDASREAALQEQMERERRSAMEADVRHLETETRRRAQLEKELQRRRNAAERSESRREKHGPTMKEIEAKQRWETEMALRKQRLEASQREFEMDALKQDEARRLRNELKEAKDQERDRLLLEARARGDARKEQLLLREADVAQKRHEQEEKRVAERDRVARERHEEHLRRLRMEAEVKELEADARLDAKPRAGSIERQRQEERDRRRALQQKEKDAIANAVLEAKLEDARKKNAMARAARGESAKEVSGAEDDERARRKRQQEEEDLQRIAKKREAAVAAARQRLAEKAEKEKARRSASQKQKQAASEKAALETKRKAELAQFEAQIAAMKNSKTATTSAGDAAANTMPAPKGSSVNSSPTRGKSPRVGKPVDEQHHALVLEKAQTKLHNAEVIAPSRNLDQVADARENARSLRIVAAREQSARVIQAKEDETRTAVQRESYLSLVERNEKDALHRAQQREQRWQQIEADRTARLQQAEKHRQALADAAEARVAARKAKIAELQHARAALLTAAFVDPVASSAAVASGSSPTPPVARGPTAASSSTISSKMNNGVAADTPTAVSDSREMLLKKQRDYAEAVRQRNAEALHYREVREERALELATFNQLHACRRMLIRRLRQSRHAVGGTLHHARQPLPCVEAAVTALSSSAAFFSSSAPSTFLPLATWSPLASTAAAANASSDTVTNPIALFISCVETSSITSPSFAPPLGASSGAFRTLASDATSPRLPVSLLGSLLLALGYEVRILSSRPMGLHATEGRPTRANVIAALESLPKADTVALVVVQGFSVPSAGVDAGRDASIQLADGGVLHLSELSQLVERPRGVQPVLLVCDITLPAAGSALLLNPGTFSISGAIHLSCVMSLRPATISTATADASMQLLETLADFATDAQRYHEALVSRNQPRHSESGVDDFQHGTGAEILSLGHWLEEATRIAPSASEDVVAAWSTSVQRTWYMQPLVAYYPSIASQYDAFFGPRCVHSTSHVRLELSVAADVMDHDDDGNAFGALASEQELSELLNLSVLETAVRYAVPAGARLDAPVFGDVATSASAAATERGGDDAAEPYQGARAVTIYFSVPTDDGDGENGDGQSDAPMVGHYRHGYAAGRGNGLGPGDNDTSRRVIYRHDDDDADGFASPSAPPAAFGQVDARWLADWLSAEGGFSVTYVSIDPATGAADAEAERRAVQLITQLAAAGSASSPSCRRLVAIGAAMSSSSSASSSGDVQFCITSALHAPAVVALLMRGCVAFRRQRVLESWHDYSPLSPTSRVAETATAFTQWELTFDTSFTFADDDDDAAAERFSRSGDRLDQDPSAPNEEEMMSTVDGVRAKDSRERASKIKRVLQFLRRLDRSGAGQWKQTFSSPALRVKASLVAECVL